MGLTNVGTFIGRGDLWSSCLQGPSSCRGSWPAGEDSGATALQDPFPGGWFQPSGGLAWVHAELAMHPRKLRTDADQLIGRQTLSRFLKRTPECHSPAPVFSAQKELP